MRRNVVFLSVVAMFTLAMGSDPSFAGKTPAPKPSHEMGQLNIKKELKEIQQLSKELNRRIRRLEALISYQQAVEARNHALTEWRALQVEQMQQGNATDVKNQITRAEETFFQQRELADQRLKQLQQLSK